TDPALQPQPSSPSPPAPALQPRPSSPDPLAPALQPSPPAKYAKNGIAGESCNFRASASLAGAHDGLTGARHGRGRLHRIVIDSPSLATYDAAMSQPTDRPILVVDDDIKIVRLVRMYLERAGHRVIEATDGRSALSAIALEAPALVVLDVMLPEVDGLAVLRAVRRHDQPPVIIVSARA